MQSLPDHEYAARRTPPIYPFSALVGQDEMKLALLLNAVSPRIAGVLVRGEKGTAKSTAVRALAALLPEITVVAGCPFGCDPTDHAHLCETCAKQLEQEGSLPRQCRPVRLVELPLGATEDRVLGTLDLERAIKEGVRHFEPGLLAAAHRGLLYIDEVNLLPDHLVDSLLDAAASGLNVVEREGISFVHPAAFLLIGTMNPEEGELRPQLLDRFGLSVEVHGLSDPALRAEVVRRRIAFEADPIAFCARWSAAEAEIRTQISAARSLLPQVTLDESMLGLIAHICARLDVDGLRADITMYKAASALAALEGRQKVTEQDIRRVAMLALPHRRRRQPFDKPELSLDQLEDAIQSYQPTQRVRDNQYPVPPAGSESVPDPGTTRPKTSPESLRQRPLEAIPPMADPTNNASTPTEQIIAPGRPTAPPELPFPRQRVNEIHKHPQAFLRALRSTRRGPTISHEHGRVQGARQPAQKPASLALASTLRAAAPYQQRRRAEHEPHGHQQLWLERWDLREPIRQRKRGALVVFAVDASGSMAARQRMAAAKGAVLALLQQVYQERDRVGLLQFHGTSATMLLAPTNSTDRASRALATLPTGGRTPLAAGLRLALRTIHAAAMHGNQEQMLLVLVTDGRANVADSAGVDAMTDALLAARALRMAGVPTLVIDTETGYPRLGLARDLAQTLGGMYVELATLEAASVTGVVRSALGRARKASIPKINGARWHNDD